MINLVTKSVTALLMMIMTTAPLIAQSKAAPTPPFKGRIVNEVLGEFRRHGLNLVFSDALVPRSLRVKDEPRPAAPRAIVSEILAAHGLALQEEKRGALLVVKSRVKPADRESPESRSQGNAAASERGWIEGLVVDRATQRPVASAVIFVDAIDAHVFSGDDGRFKIDSVPSGVQMLRVEASGYEPASSPELKISPRRATTITITLIASPQFREDVMVTAPVAPPPAGVTTSSYGIASEEIRRSAGGLGDVNRYVQSLPGLAAVGDIRNDLVARGGSPVENLTRVDGFETPTLSHFSTVGGTGGVVTLLNAELIADATFLTGGFPADYGDRLSSVLDVRLREGNRTRHAFEADVNFAGASIVAEGPLGSAGKGSWIGTVRRSFVDLLANSANIASVPEMTAYTFKVAYDIGRRHKVWAVSFGGAERIDFNLDDDDPDEPDYVGIEHRGGRTVFGIGWRHLLWDRAFGVVSFSNSSAGYEIDARDRLLGGDSLILRDHSTESVTTIQYDLSWQPFSTWTIRSGALVKALGRDLDLAQPKGVQIPYSVRPREDTPGLTLDFTATAPIAAAYVQASGQVLPRTTLTGGLRVTRFVELGDVKAYDPRGGVEFRLSRTVRLSVAAGRYHQQPELVSVVAVPGNANLAPIEADHLVGGVKYEPDAGLLISAEVYRKWYRAYPVSLEYPQLTLANHGSEFNTSDLLLLPMTSDGKGRVRGLEFFLKKRLTAGLYGQMAYSWSRTEQAARDAVFRRGSFDTPHVMTAIAGYRIGEHWEISSRFTYATGRPYTPPLLPESVDQNRLIYDVARFNAARLPAFHRLDLRIDRKFTLFGRSTSLFADMQNLYNRRAVIEYSWNQKTRELYAEKQLEFLPIVGINIEF